ncbi:MAG TPA: hypothetical protein VGQ46_21435 [Thermoanaerobaculia bacterium]|nr:hypothetical protein [Thermoanaerobaculia bacterium]
MRPVLSLTGRAVLIRGGAFLLSRSGAPAMMFVALAIYGGAMLAIARLRSV